MASGLVLPQLGFFIQAPLLPIGGRVNSSEKEINKDVAEEFDMFFQKACSGRVFSGQYELPCGPFLKMTVKVDAKPRNQRIARLMIVIDAYAEDERGSMESQLSYGRGIDVRIKQSGIANKVASTVLWWCYMWMRPRVRGVVPLLSEHEQASMEKMVVRLSEEISMFRKPEVA